MSRYPRIVGAIALLWNVRIAFFPDEYPSGGHAAVLAFVWTFICLQLVRGRHVRTFSVALVLAAVFEMAWPMYPDPDNTPLVALCWLGIFFAVTEGRPYERALLVRVMVSVIYLATGIVKLNPSFIAGEQIVRIATTRQQMAPLAELMQSEVGLVVAWLTVATELWLGIGLWFRRTRVPTAILGVGLHVTLVAATAPTLVSVPLLTLLNLLLVSGYLAFFVNWSTGELDDDARLVRIPGLRASAPGLADAPSRDGSW